MQGSQQAGRDMDPEVVQRMVELLSESRQERVDGDDSDPELSGILETHFVWLRQQGTNPPSQWWVESLGLGTPAGPATDEE